jgi:predicted N-formylglutamate amidohydrolase
LAGLPREEAGDAVRVEGRRDAGRFLIVCDHASNALPSRYGDLGLDAERLASHIAWDPGALAVARGLAERLGAPLVHSTVSRLVVDVNRPPTAPDLIVETSETTRIPGNADLSEAERQRRVAAVHAPYHAAIERVVDARLAAGRATSLIAIHSFEPVYRGVRRPWPVGVIFDRDRRLADILIQGLGAAGLDVGVNAPYSPADRVYYTLSRHGEARGLACVMLEIRNDLIRSAEAGAAWAERLASLLQAAAGMEPRRAVLA